MQKKALGKGLEALLPENYLGASLGELIQELELSQIIPNRYQPRQIFDGEGLKELAVSIKAKGVVTPVLVRKIDADRYELIAGERRWRAAGMAGRTRIPAIVKEAAGSEPLELALIENLLRKDLNPLEAAKAYHRLVEEFQITQDDISRVVGKERSTVANYLRLLNLPETIQADLLADRLTLGHAKAILSLERASDQIRVAREIVAHRLSVREAENLARRVGKGPTRRLRTRTQPAEVSHLRDQLSYRLGTKVKVLGGAERGQIVIEYYTAEDLNRISEVILH
jgi:ParB family transcriptional regulator, chromosome partitioning protein